MLVYSLLLGLDEDPQPNPKWEKYGQGSVFFKKLKCCFKGLSIFHRLETSY